MDAEGVPVDIMTGLVWFAISYGLWRLIKWALLAPIARAWRERPVVLWDDRENRWRAASRIGSKHHPL